MKSPSNIEYLHNPMWYSLHDFLASIEFLCMLNHSIFIILIPLLMSKLLCFVLRSYVCKILGLYHVLMYVCRLHRFVLPRFFCLYWLPMYVDPAVFFVLRSYIYKILYVLIYLDYWFLFLTIFMLVLNSHVCEIVRFFAFTEFLRSKFKHFIPIKNKMYRWPLKRPRRW
jgi:hypothetical protein